MSTKIIAFYLPQFHPVSENDIWYGEGFTEWTNVAKAKKLFFGHYQPHVPANLGFYDLRVKENQLKQIELAKQYGIDVFCYWHYWFGNGKRLLQMPFDNVVNDQNLNFPFCLAWANHSWEKKLWNNQKNNQTIMKQEYFGPEDYQKHFYELLNAFQDKRYFRVDEKIFFVIYAPLDNLEIVEFIRIWRELAKKENLNDFYFVGKTFDSKDKEKILNLGFDAIYNDTTLLIHTKLPKPLKVYQLLKRKILRKPTVFKYKNAIKYMNTQDNKSGNTIPVVAPNWDHSPRSGNNSLILHDSKPKYFEKILDDVFHTIQSKDEKDKIIIIKSWNEWGEGNHLEPDLRFGTKYLDVVLKVKKKYDGDVNE